MSVCVFQPSSASVTPPGYSLHQLQGNKTHGSVKEGYLLKKSEGMLKKIWQKRKCRIKDGIMSISHSDVSNKLESNKLSVSQGTRYSPHNYSIVWRSLFLSFTFHHLWIIFNILIKSFIYIFAYIFDIHVEIFFYFRKQKIQLDLIC